MSNTSSDFFWVGLHDCVEMYLLIICFAFFLPITKTDVDWMSSDSCGLNEYGCSVRMLSSGGIIFGGYICSLAGLLIIRGLVILGVMIWRSLIGWINGGAGTDLMNDCR